MPPLKSGILVESLNRNKYLYDRGRKQLHPCHPALYFLMELNEKGVDLREWINRLNTLPGTDAEIEGPGKFPIEKIEYYYEKLMLLKENGYFNSLDQEQLLSRVLTGKDVEGQLANSWNLTLEVTERCDLDCGYCGYGEYYDQFTGRKNRDMDPGLARTVIDYFLDLWNSPLNRSFQRPTYIGFYGGEPLLNFPLVQEITRYIAGLKSTRNPRNRFIFNMTTNGLHLGKYLDFLVKHDFRLSISLDGGEENNTYRVFKKGRPSFNHVIKEVKALQRKYPDYFKRQVHFNAVLHNKNSSAEIYRFFKETFAKIPQVNPLNNTGLRENLKKNFYQTYLNPGESLPVSEDYSASGEGFSKEPGFAETSMFLRGNTDFCFDNYNQLLYPPKNRRRIPTGTCLPFSKRIFVTTAGNVLGCERIGERYSLGHITPGKVDIDTEAIAAEYNSWYKKMRNRCGSCYNAEGCLQCMFFLDLEDGNPPCKGWMSYRDYSRYIAAHINALEKSPGSYFQYLKPEPEKPPLETKEKCADNTHNAYWFYIDTYVHISIKKDRVLLYNTLNGKRLEYTGTGEIPRLIKKINGGAHLRVIGLRGKDMANPVISGFIEAVKSSFMGDVIAASYSKGKPIQWIPRVTVNNDIPRVKKGQKPSAGENAPDYMDYIASISLYINGLCHQGCDCCGNAYKQFLCCTSETAAKDRRYPPSTRELDLDAIKHILTELKSVGSANIDFLGGDIFAYTRFDELLEWLRTCPPDLRCTFYSHYLNAVTEAGIEHFPLLRRESFTLKIPITFPVHREKLERVAAAAAASNLEHRFLFIVGDEQEFQQARDILSTTGNAIKQYSFQPYYNKENMAFFREIVFTGKEDIYAARPSIHEIHTRSLVNSLNFGRLTVLNNGNVYANVNAARLGVLGRDTLQEMVYKELTRGTGWRRTRGKVKPCRGCVFRDLCPPLTNYTHALGKNDLCSNTQPIVTCHT